MTNLTEVLTEQVQDLYNAENQLAKCLPKMAKKAKTPALKSAFTKHLEQTKAQIERLKQVAEQMGVAKPTGKVCKAMKGLIEEGSEVLEEDGSNEAIDAALIAAAQRIEHYEIAAYGTVCKMADVLGHAEGEEAAGRDAGTRRRQTDELLSNVAEQSVYPNAAKTEDDEEQEEMPAKTMKKTTKAKKPMMT